MAKTEKNLVKWFNSNLVSLGLPVRRTSNPFTITPLRQEASRRQYFRIKTHDTSANFKENTFIGVYSPPKTESNEQFIFLSKYLKSNGVMVPEVIISDSKLGFMLVEDFGDKSYQFSTNKENYHHLYSAAIDEMVLIHSCPNHPNLPILNKDKISDQMDLFRDWFLTGLLNIEISSKEDKLICGLFEVILDDLIKQPQVLCHFDFECRNIMVLENGNAGVLDFQDAIFGPIFLDPVSLFKDLYFEMSETELESILGLYISKASESGLIEYLETSKIRRSFDLTGLQRQLRIMGTLSRLYLRDNKPFRLPDLIKTLDLAAEASSRYLDLKEFSDFLRTKISPVLIKTLKEIL
tara:strand:+ start:1435 stop:2487 length:1053 start_codon:yes stop_codon:yes gene_type:complete